MYDLFAKITAARDDGDQWCSVEKANALAALVLSLRPGCVVEIGVFRGASALPMLIAMKANPPSATTGRLGAFVAIDPWSKDAAIAGENEENARWWAAVDLERAFRDFCARLERASVRTLCQIIRAPSDLVAPPDAIDLLHIDGSHTEQAIRDVTRFASRVQLGGVLVLDDVEWAGGHVKYAQACARDLGFVELYRIGQCAFMQRVRK